MIGTDADYFQMAGAAKDLLTVNTGPFTMTTGGGRRVRIPRHLLVSTSQPEAYDSKPDTDFTQLREENVNAEGFGQAA
ncbi:hypothetical protein ACFT7S_26480 [Streptomyces sp. NPDC057136]|uniref:hypothetical protein n=1 Tax=Streptomyces sp. NPDC057136 TaxID=3346029 RepID=UPI003637BA83